MHLPSGCMFNWDRTVPTKERGGTYYNGWLNMSNMEIWGCRKTNKGETLINMGSEVELPSGCMFDWDCIQTPVFFFSPWTSKVPVNPVFSKSFTGTFLRSRALSCTCSRALFCGSRALFFLFTGIFSVHGHFFSVHGHFFLFTGTFLSKLFTGKFSRFMGKKKNTDPDNIIISTKRNIIHRTTKFVKYAENGGVDRLIQGKPL